ncbi:MAG: hypothetical protein HFF18_00715 [Oscillospiraceae bacterium]|nr:hypothetical protein [Oscillospiraceae bacterium]
MAMCPTARNFFVWQTIFSQESKKISRKNCAAQAEKGPLLGHVDMFQTRPKLFSPGDCAKAKASWLHSIKTGKNGYIEDIGSEPAQA